MWRIVQRDAPEDYVVATGTSFSVRDFCARAFARVGLNYEDHVAHDPRYLRPAEVDHLIGDSSKARAALGWRPTIGFEALVDMMVDADMEIARREKAMIDAGHTADRPAGDAD
jgi:GDPmannose 4,6-dehydratase